VPGKTETNAPLPLNLFIHSKYYKMKRVSFLLSVSMTLLFFSCNNQTSTSEESKTADTASTATTPAVEEKPAFTPYKVVIIQHKVKNFDKAVAGYFSKDSVLKAFGLHHEVLARDLKDSNQIFVIDRIENIDSAKAFFKHPKVIETMEKAGVSRAPGYSYAEIVRENNAPRANMEGMSISHHVKDFDAWLKAFDAHASERTANGLVEGVIARDINDPNLVYVTFEVTDVEKAKARMASPEAKKNMSDAGVDSPPTTRWFKVVK